MPFPSATRFVLAIVTTALLLFLAEIGWPAAAPYASAPQSTIPSPDTLRGCGGAQFPSSDEAFEQEVLRPINQVRLGNGLLPLKEVDSLTSAARFHATDMSEESYFSHQPRPQQRRTGGVVRLELLHPDLLHRSRNSISENIAAGFATPQSVVDAWTNSPYDGKDPRFQLGK